MVLTWERMTSSLVMAARGASAATSARTGRAKVCVADALCSSSSVTYSTMTCGCQETAPGHTGIQLQWVGVIVSLIPEQQQSGSNSKCNTTKRPTLLLRHAVVVDGAHSLT